MDSKEAKAGSVNRLAGQMAGQTSANKQYKPFRSKSKDKLINGRIGCTVHKNMNYSKVPRISRISSKTNTKSPVRLEGKLDNSGDNKAGTSSSQNTQPRKNFAPEKLKPSHIPRRKISYKENSKKDEYQRNVQRVQLLISQDFRPENQVPGPAVASTRPIPTLGQLYARNNVTDTDRLDDWFVELDTPANSMASNFFQISSRLVDSRVNAANDITPTSKFNVTTVTNMEFDSANCPQNDDRATEENVSDWMSSDVEYPTRDNESGYRSLSPPTHTPVEIKSKHSQCSSVSTQKENISENNDQQLSESSSKKSIQDSLLTNESTTNTLKEQPTVILAQITPVPINEKSNGHSNHGEHEKKSEADHSKNNQYPSRTGDAQALPVEGNQPKVTVPSYVECPSEILQKTTNFEDMIPVTCDSPKTLSSVAATELEFHDDLSSQYTMEREDCGMEHCALEWCHQCRACRRDEKSNDSEDTSVADSLICQYNDEFMPASVMNPSDDQYVHRCHWKRHYNAVKHCKKCQRYRRFPSTRYTLPKTLSSLRRRMSLRICRRRLSRVWKRTTERWAMWSAKSPQKFKKLRLMNYLQRSILWEDANVQTNVFVYRETGTEPTLKEQKSAAVSTILKYGASFIYDKNGSGKWVSSSRMNPSQIRQINVGQVKLPPFYNSKKTSLTSEIFQGKQASIEHVNDVDWLKLKNKTHKNENHVITQTLSCFQSKDDTEIKQKYIPERESDNFIEICEVSMDDKHTGMEDMTFPMKDNVTSTMLDLEDLREMNHCGSQNVHTQMCVVCNNAETDVKFPSTRDNRSASVLTSISENFHRPYGTNTDLRELCSISLMTSTNFLKKSPTYSHIDTQVTPVQSLRKISTGILTSKSFLGSKSEKIDISTGMDDDVENRYKHFNNQVMPQQPSFMCAVNRSTSTNTAAVQKSFTVTSKKELHCAEVLPSQPQFKSGVCLTSPSLQLKCRCPNTDILSRGTETSGSKHITSSKLKTYFNTGMLINTLVEGAIVNGSAKHSGSKDRYPARLSVDGSTFSKRESKPADNRGSNSTRASVLSQRRTDTCTQYSNIAEKDTVSCRSDRIGHSRLMAVRTLSQPADEEAQTEPVRIDGIPNMPAQYKCTSVFTSQCALDQPIQQAVAVSKNIGHTSKDLTSSAMTSRRMSGSNRNSSFRQNTSAVLSSDLDADKWIKSCIEKGYRSQLEGESSLNDKHTSEYDSCSSKSPDKKSDWKSVGSETQSAKYHMIPNVTTVASAITVTPLDNYNDPKKDTSDKQLVKMVDDITSGKSDDVVRKEVKEITLHVNPENSEAGPTCPTKPNSKFSIMLKLDNSIKSKCVITINFSKSKRGTECAQAVDKKSVSVFTSRCILPSYQMQHCGSLAGDCLLVYGKPKCVIHTKEEYADASVQMNSQNNYSSLPNQMQSDFIQQQHLPSEGRYKANIGLTTSTCSKKTQNISEILQPKVYEALYETTITLSQEPSKTGLQDAKDLCGSYGVDAEIEAHLLSTPELQSTSMLASPEVRSASVITSHLGHSYTVQQCDQFTEQDPLLAYISEAKSDIEQGKTEDGMQSRYKNEYVRLLDIPTHDDDPDCGDQQLKSHLVTSCRYYSTLLTKQLNRVRENLTKHLTPSANNFTYQSPNVYTEACTMKPSAREEFGCQTFRNRPCFKGSKFTTTLSPAVSLTDICRHDKEHLKSVYYTLTAIEGRLRRFKANIE